MTLSIPGKRRVALRQPHAPTGELVERFDRDGYAIVPDALTPAEVDALRDEARRICRGEAGPVRGLVPPAPGEDDDSVFRRCTCIHFPHKISKLMLDALCHPSVADALTQVIGPNVKAVESLLFMKSPGKPGQPWHQDEYFIPTRDRSLTAIWLALDDATVTNGCLWALPGSHRPGVIYPDREHDDPRFDCASESYDFPYREEDAIPLEVPAGAIIVIDGYLLHRSLPNVGDTGLRRSMVNHYMSAESLLPWQKPPAGTHLAKWDYRDIVMVAGTDPYAWKGITDVSDAHVRPEREGGCAR